MARTQIPVIGLTGYLGAGKTTLLNHLLRTPGARIGVVVNDFGVINVDAGLITGQVDAAESIAGGCVCCLDDSGVRPGVGHACGPSAATGCDHHRGQRGGRTLGARPADSFQSGKNVRPGGLIEVVDAANYFDTVDTHDQPPARFEAASLVVLNKIDLLEGSEQDHEAQLARIAARIALRNGQLPLIRARRGAIDPDLVFDVALAEDPEDQLPLGALLRAEHGSHTHQHAAAVTLDAPEPISASALVDLLERPPSGVYRLKGIVPVATARGAKWWAVNLTGRQIHVASHRASDRASNQPGLVAIGVGIDEQAVRAVLETAVQPSGAADAAGMRRLQRHARLSA